MPQYFWLQQVGGEDPWVEALSEHRQQIISQRKPAFTTVLDAHSSPDDTWGRDDFAKMRYSGCLYFDWDADDISETIPQFHKFLARLNAEGVNLNCIRLYATGGRGFHAEFPEAMFMAKVPKNGTLQLPYIYKEMALELAVDTLDLRIYTGRKGRMWRTPGVQRSNGKYKVSLTLDQALQMTPELYDEVCSKPNSEAAIYRHPPELSTYLAALFTKSQAKVDFALKTRKASAGDEAVLARYKGDFPPSVKRVMRGDSVMPNMGFHKIAMQLAVTANALGKSREELVEACADLCENHSSDSQRYNSPRKRKEELRRMWDYTHENPCYGFSKGGIRSLLVPGTPTSDLDGVQEGAGVGHVPDSVEPGGKVDEPELSQDALDEIAASHNSLLEGMMILNDGIFKRTSDGAKMLSNLSMRSPAKMIDTEDGLLVGIEAELVADGHSHGRGLIELPVFSSRSNLAKFCAGRSAIFSGSETQAGVVQLLLARAAIKGKKVIYIVHKEGLDIVQNPLITDRVSKDVIWGAVDSVRVAPRDDGLSVNYRFRPKVGGDASFKSDVHLAPPIGKNPDSVGFLRALLTINNPVVVAQMLGWFVSCFHKQFYQAAFNQFPLLHPNGPAGSGKSMTTTLMDRMFFFRSTPKVYGSSQQAASNFHLKAAWTGSSSVPLVLDEYKPTELGHIRHDFLLQHFRLLYNQGSGASGGINRGGAESSFRDVTNYSYSAPTAFLGETQELQTAIVQRCVPVSFTPADAKRHTPAYDHAVACADMMPMLGSALLRWSMHETQESRVEAITPIIKDLRGALDNNVHDRQVYNLAVVMAGLDFMAKVVKDEFGDEFTAEFELLRGSLYDSRVEVSAAVMSEAAKALNDLSHMSRHEVADSEFAIRNGFEYLVGEGWIEILMRESFIKYFAWCKRKGFPPLYQSADSFIAAMAKSPAMMDKTCFDSKLRANGSSSLAKVFRFNLQQLAAEGVEPFKVK